MYDVTRPKTFEAVTKWKDDIDENLQPAIPVVLLANKCDLLDPQDRQRREELDQLKKLIRDKDRELKDAQ